MTNLHPTFAPSPAPRRRRSSAGVAHASDLAAFTALNKKKTVPATTLRRRFSLTREKRTWVDTALDKPQIAAGILVTTVFLLGTLISVLYDTAIVTSHIAHVHNSSVERAMYFARKRNIINQLFVKRAWAWTVLAYLFHLFTTPRRPDISAPSIDHVPGRVNPALHVYSPQKRGTRAQRLSVLVLASLAWIAFTSWCFGAGLGDRIIAGTGGVCSVPVPAGVDKAVLEPLLNSPEALATATELLSHPHPNGELVFLPLPAKYCLRVPLNPKSHPALFSILSAAHDTHVEVHKALHLPPPRWSGGFDISGHAFLLTLASLILAAEVAPSWRAYRERGYTQRHGGKARLHAFATVVATALIGLWVWMLFMTAIYFHDVDEKLAGLVLGLFAAGVIHTVIPRQSGPVIEFKVRGPTRRPSPQPITHIDHPEPVHPFDEREVEREVSEKQ